MMRHKKCIHILLKYNEREFLKIIIYSYYIFPLLSNICSQSMKAKIDI